MIYIYRVTAGQERVVLEMLARRIRKEKLPIHCVVQFDDLRGYMMVEADDELTVRQAGMKIPHIKGVLDKPTKIEDLEVLLSASKPAALTVSKGDIVELVSGPFKGEKARVMKIDENKDVLTVELTEVAVPIPVTIKANTIRIFQKAQDVQK